MRDTGQCHICLLRYSYDKQLCAAEAADGFQRDKNYLNVLHQ